MTPRKYKLITPAEAREMLKGLPPWYRRAMPKGAYERYVKSREKIPPHGSVEGSAQELAGREAWFCHNYPMAECHYGAYQLDAGLVVLFANDGYPAYNVAFLERELASAGIEIAAKVVEQSYTTVFLVRTDDLAAMSIMVWESWKDRCLGQVLPDYGNAAAAYFIHQAATAYELMAELGNVMRFASG